MAHTIETTIESRGALSALVCAVRAIELIEFEIGPSGVGLEGGRTGKPSSKPPPGNRRAASALARAQRHLERVVEEYEALNPQHESRKTVEEREIKRIIQRAKKAGVRFT